MLKIKLLYCQESLQPELWANELRREPDVVETLRTSSIEITHKAANYFPVSQSVQTG